MTNELAIRILTGDVLGTTEQTQEAIEMAVKALSNTNGETIYRQDAIDLLQKWSDGYKYIETETELAIKDFQHLPSAQQWIPVTERLPDVRERVLAQQNDGTMMVLKCIDGGHLNWFYSRTVAWMPLPEKYKEH
jgi:hypothetical protein